MGWIAGCLPTVLRGDFTGTMQLLRNPQFQEARVNHPRAGRTFWIANDAIDEVSRVH